MSSVLLNIGHDIGAILIELLDHVNKIRGEVPILKIFLWPVAYALLFAKVIVLVLANGSHRFYNYSLPEGIVNTRNHLYSATPYSVLCFNKRGFLLFIMELYAWYFFFIFVWDRPLRLYAYLVVKIVVTVVPFLMLTPVQRLPFWIFAVILTVFEIWMGLWLILAQGFGIDFVNGHFYNHWPKHYRYRAPTSNRELTVELSCYIFVIIKLLILNDYFCFNVDRREARLKAPHTPTRGGLDASTLLDDTSSPHRNLGYAFIGVVLFYIIFCFLPNRPAFVEFFVSKRNTVYTLLTRFAWHRLVPPTLWAAAFGVCVSCCKEEFTLKGPLSNPITLCYVVGFMLISLYSFVLLTGWGIWFRALPRTVQTVLSVVYHCVLLYALERAFSPAALIYKRVTMEPYANGQFQDVVYDDNLIRWALRWSETACNEAVCLYNSDQATAAKLDIGKKCCYGST